MRQFISASKPMDGISRPQLTIFDENNFPVAVFLELTDEEAEILTVMGINSIIDSGTVRPGDVFKDGQRIANIKETKDIRREIPGNAAVQPGTVAGG